MRQCSKMSPEYIALAPCSSLLAGPLDACLRGHLFELGIGDDTRVSSAAAAMRTVEALLREREAGGRFSGVVGIKQGDQELLLDAFGYASRAWSAPTTVETRFDTASITKLFTAVATLQLVEKGAFALDTSVIRYLGLRKPESRQRSRPTIC